MGRSVLWWWSVWALAYKGRPVGRSVCLGGGRFGEGRFAGLVVNDLGLTAVVGLQRQRSLLWLLLLALSPLAIVLQLVNLGTN